MGGCLIGGMFDLGGVLYGEGLGMGVSFFSNIYKNSRIHRQPPPGKVGGVNVNGKHRPATSAIPHNWPKIERFYDRERVPMGQKA